MATSIQDEELIIPGLLPQLCPYQRKAVQWMLRCERPTRTTNDEWELAWVVLSSRKQSNETTKFPIQHISSNNTKVSLEQHQYPIFLPTWNQNQKAHSCYSNSCNSDDDDVLLFCPYMGWFTNSIELAKVWTIGPSSTTTTGGLLAEAMGLGKTVEVLACILANPRPNQLSSATSMSAIDKEEDRSDSSD
jgi:SNF2 family DNA or RNA helicase